MNIIWDKQAKQRVDDTVEYIAAHFGNRIAAEFLTNVLHSVELLVQMPYLGQEEPLLRKSKWHFRSLVIHRQNKLIYLVRNDEILIADFWDTRMNPKTLAGRLSAGEE